jgi:WD40 repeat protein
VYSAAFSSDRSRIVTASGDQTARIWDAASAKEIAVLRGHGDRVHSASPTRKSPNSNPQINVNY